MADDSYVRKTYLEEQNVTVETNYRLGFDADRTCGFTRIFMGKAENPGPDDELYEVYMELHECGLTVEQVQDKENKIIGEVKSGKLDVTF